MYGPSESSICEEKELGGLWQPPDLMSANSSEEFQTFQPHFQGLQPLDAHHDEDWQVLPSDPESDHSDTARLLPLTSPRSSSVAHLPLAASLPPVASLPPGAAPPIPNPVYHSSSYVGAPPLRRPHNKDIQERKKNPCSTSTTVSILNVLNPQFSPPTPNPDGSRLVRNDDTAVYGLSEGSVREEKKERSGFWSWATTGDRNKEDGQQDLMRTIGYLITTSFEDWEVVLEVCERASATKANAKKAAKALCEGFEHGDASQQLSAARLWAIMLRNSSMLFVRQCVKSKFLDTLESVLTSQRTSPVVRDRLLDVLAAAAYAGPRSGFCLLWRKVKPAGRPDEGVPFNSDDAMFSPPSPRQSTTPRCPQPPMSLQFINKTAPPLDTSPQAKPKPKPKPLPLRPQSQAQKQSNRAEPEAPCHPQLQRVVQPEGDMRRPFRERCFADGNAVVWDDSLAFASPEDLREKDTTKEQLPRAPIETNEALKPLLLVYGDHKIMERSPTSSISPNLTQLPMQAEIPELLAQNEFLKSEQRRLEIEILKSEQRLLENEIKEAEARSREQERLIREQQQRQLRQQQQYESFSGSQKYSDHSFAPPSQFSSSTRRSSTPSSSKASTSNINPFGPDSSSAGSSSSRALGHPGKPPTSPFDYDESILEAMQLQNEFDKEEYALSAQRTELSKSVQRLFKCGICMEEMPDDSVACPDPCGHTFCRKCLRGHVAACLSERIFPIPCPTCTAGKGKGKEAAGEISQSLALDLGLTKEQFSVWTEMEMVSSSVSLYCQKCQRTTFVARDEHEEAKIIACPLPDCNHAWCKQCQQSIDLNGPRHSCDGTLELGHLVKKKV